MHLDKKIPWKYQFWDFQVLWWNFAKFLMSFLKAQVSFSDSSVSWKITLLYFFRSNVIYFGQTGPIKVQILETFECSDQNSPNSCHFVNNKSGFLQILHQSSVSWSIIPLYFLSWNFIYVQHKEPLKVQIWWGEILPEQSKVRKFALWWAPFVKIT